MFRGGKHNEIIKRVETRWLFLDNCVNLEIKEFDGLKSYFLSEQFSEARAKPLEKHCNDPMTNVYLTFHQAALPVFLTFTKFF